MSQICQKCGSEKIEGWEHGSLCDGCYVVESRNNFFESVSHVTSGEGLAVGPSISNSGGAVVASQHSGKRLRDS